MAPRRRRLLLAAVLIAIILALAAVVVLQPSHEKGSRTSATSLTGHTTESVTASSTVAASLPSEATYLTSSAPNSSQWLIVRSISSPASVSANNTGTLQEYESLALLNETKIGVFCVSVSATGACADFQQYFETGWFWNRSTDLLYVHYVGGNDVLISVYTQSK